MFLLNIVWLLCPFCRNPIGLCRIGLRVELPKIPIKVLQTHGTPCRTTHTECGAEPSLRCSLFARSRERTADWLIIQLEYNYSANPQFVRATFHFASLRPNPELNASPHKLVRGKDSLALNSNKGWNPYAMSYYGARNAVQHSRTTQHQNRGRIEYLERIPSPSAIQKCEATDRDHATPFFLYKRIPSSAFCHSNVQ